MAAKPKDRFSQDMGKNPDNIGIIYKASIISLKNLFIYFIPFVPLEFTTLQFLYNILL